MTKLSDLLPKGDDKTRVPLSNGMVLQITKINLLPGKKWETAQIDARTPKHTDINLYTTSKVIIEQLRNILEIFTPSEKNPLECNVNQILSETTNQNYLILE